MKLSKLCIECHFYKSSIMQEHDKECKIFTTNFYNNGIRYVMQIHSIYTNIASLSFSLPATNSAHICDTTAVTELKSPQNVINRQLTIISRVNMKLTFSNSDRNHGWKLGENDRGTRIRERRIAMPRSFVRLARMSSDWTMAGNKTSVIKQKFQLSCATKRGSVSRGIHNGKKGERGGGANGNLSHKSWTRRLLWILRPFEKWGEFYKIE